MLSSVLVPRASPALDSKAVLTLPQPIISHLLASCFTAIVNSESAEPTVFQKPLSLIYQRYPIIWSAQTKEFSTRLQSSNEQALPRLLQAMNAVLGGSSLSADASTALAISSSSPDVAIRVSALKDVFKNAEDIKANGNDLFLRDTILARLSEHDHEVARVVLAEEYRSIVEACLEPREILAAVESPIKTGDVEYLNIVLPFLTGSFVSAHSQLADEIVKNILWPRLLASKADLKANGAILKALQGTSIEKTHPWLKDIGSTSAAEGVEINSKVVDILARNFAALPSEQQDEAEAFLLAQLALPSPPHLALLVTQAYANKAARSRRVAFAQAVLVALKVEQHGLSGFSAAQPDKLFTEAGLLEPTLLQNVFVHPTVAKTVRQVRAASIVSVVQAVQPVKEANWSWLSTSNQDAVVAAYRSLCVTIYRVAHTNSSTPGSAALATSLLAPLFTTLVADDVVAFLASIFSSSHLLELRLAALRDSAVFIDVLSTVNDKKTVDWQIVVPCFLSALGDAEKKIRVEGLKVLEKIRDVMVAKEGSKVGTVYGRDHFYGPASCKILGVSTMTRIWRLTRSFVFSLAQIPRRSRPPRLPHQGPLVSQRD